MQVTPRTEQQIAEMNVWPADRAYHFKVLEHFKFGQNTYHTEDTVSKKQNEMIRLVVQVFNDNNDSKVFMDFLLDSFPAKLRSACIACGLLNNYSAGHVHGQDFIGKTGKCTLRIEDDVNGNKRNAIASYLVGDQAANLPMASEYIPAGEGHLDVPFA